MRIVLAIAALASLVTPIDQAAAQAKTEAGDVQVTATYTGKGQVDATHEIWVFLFETPTPENQPAAVQTITKQGGTAAFKGVTSSPVYVFVVYDEAGDYDGNSAPPPPGTPAGMYSTNGTEAAPVKPGPDAKVKVTFDDSRRMNR